MPKHILTPEDRQEILLKSDRYTAKQLAEQYGCSRSTILKLWMDNNYHKPIGFSYYVNDNYFSNINSANKAYIVGLIASDGNVYKRSGHGGQLRFCFQNGESEYNLLMSILADMQSTCQIRTNNVTINDKTYENISATIVSETIFNDLCNIGIFPQKTWKMNILDVISHIPMQFLRDFLRGYFDGDGCITMSKRDKNIPSNFFVNIAIPLSNAILLQEHLNTIGISTMVVEDKREDKYTHKFARIDFFGANKYTFLKWIYYGDCLCLQRKYEIALQYCQLVEDNITNRSENKKAIDMYNNFINLTDN